MDAESLVQIEQIVSAAISKETQVLGASLRQEIGEKAETLAASVRQEIGEKAETLAASLRQEIGEKAETLAASLRQELSEKTEEMKRHSGVLYEDLGHKLDLVVEGHQALHQKIERLETKMEHEFLEMRALIQLSYRQLQERVETLEQRVQFIEKRLGLSA